MRAIARQKVRVAEVALDLLGTELGQQRPLTIAARSSINIVMVMPRQPRQRGTRFETAVRAHSRKIAVFAEMLRDISPVAATALTIVKRSLCH